MKFEYSQDTWQVPAREEPCGPQVFVCRLWLSGQGDWIFLMEFLWGFVPVCTWQAALAFSLKKTFFQAKYIEEARSLLKHGSSTIAVRRCQFMCVPVSYEPLHRHMQRELFSMSKTLLHIGRPRGQHIG